MANDIVDAVLQESIAAFAQSSRKQKYKHDPALWAKDVLGIHLWSKQRDVAESVVANKRTAVKSAHDMGKSLSAAVLACWWIAVHEPGEAIVITTAPTYQQVHGIIWREMAKMHSLAEAHNNPLPGYITQGDKWNIVTDNGNFQAGWGRKPADTNLHGFQGVHERYVLAIIDEACHDDQTEFLTKRGWVLGKDLSKDDLFLTKNITTGLSEYQKASRIVDYEYNGDMYYYEPQRGGNFAVTPNHDMLYNNAYNKTLQKRRIDEIDFSGNTRIPRVIDSWHGDNSAVYEIPAYQGKRKFFPARKVNALDYAEFAGWFYSEGSISKDLYTVMISQSEKNAENRDKIRAVLDRLGFNYSEYSRNFLIFDTGLAHHLVKTGRTCDVKRLPEDIKNWSVDKLNIFLDSYVAGDGYVNGSRDIIYTSCKEMADDLHEIILKTGVPGMVSKRKLGTAQPLADGRAITSSRDGFIITRPAKNTDMKLVRRNLDIRPYSGRVYCATVPNGTLMTRRNGRAMWSGNCGINESLWTAVEAITTTGDARILAIGNPDDPNTYFGKIFNNSNYSREWNLLTISAFDSPNLTRNTDRDRDKDLPDEIRPLLIQPETVESWRRQWGEDDPRWKSKILGEFPDQSSNSLFSQSIIDTGVETSVQPGEYDRPILGVDLARFGDNLSTVYMSVEGEVMRTVEQDGDGEAKLVPTGKRGKQVRFIKEWAKVDAVESAKMIHQIALEQAASEVRIDTAGYGAGVKDQVAVLAQTTYKVTEMNGSGPTPDLYRWINARAWWHESLAEGLRNGTIDISYDDEKLKNDLLGIQYHFKNRYRSMQVESKDDMAKRNIASPDHSDAAVYAAAPITVTKYTGLTPGTKIAFDTDMFTGGEKYSRLGAY